MMKWQQIPSLWGTAGEMQLRLNKQLQQTSTSSVDRSFFTLVQLRLWSATRLHGGENSRVIKKNISTFMGLGCRQLKMLLVRLGMVWLQNKLLSCIAICSVIVLWGSCRAVQSVSEGNAPVTTWELCEKVEQRWKTSQGRAKLAPNRHVWRVEVTYF